MNQNPLMFRSIREGRLPKPVRLSVCGRFNTLNWGYRVIHNIPSVSAGLFIKWRIYKCLFITNKPLPPSRPDNVVFEFLGNNPIGEKLPHAAFHLV